MHRVEGGEGSRLARVWWGGRKSVGGGGRHEGDRWPTGVGVMPPTET